MRSFITICLFLLCAIASLAQSDTYRLEKRYDGGITDFSVDNLGNVYIVFKTGQLKKLNANGDSVAVFNAVRNYGTLYSIDATNPLKLILFYRDYGTIVALDRFLNVRNTIDLRKLNIFQVKAVGLSYDNNVWVFDEPDGKLKRISEEGRIIDQTNDLRFVFDSIPSPHQLMDHDRLVHLYDSTKGLYLFDYYGALKNRVKLLHWRDLTVIGKSVFGHNGQQLLKYDVGTLSIQELPLPLSWRNASRLIITSRKIYVLLNGAIEVYSSN